MSRNLTARDVMQGRVITVSPGMSLATAREIFARHRITGAPVVDENGDLVGAISQTDIARIILQKESDDYPENSYFIGLPAFLGGSMGIEATNLAEQLATRTIEEAMTTDVYTVSPDDRLSVLAVTMRHHRIHRLIVVEQRRVVGIVSTLDLIQILEDH